jgi:carboxylate-amine ligase
VHGTFVCEGGAISVPALVDLVIEETKTDAAALGCSAELERCRTIAGAGTSADAQLALFHAHGRTGGRTAALQAVTRWLAAATLE